MGIGGEAAAKHRRGVDLANRGRYSNARRVLAAAYEAAEAAGDVNLMARIVGTVAYVLARLGDVDEGERLCLEMLSREGLDDVTVAQLHGQLGALALERGHPDRAVEWLTKGANGLRGEPVRRANVLMNRSLVEMDRGRLDAAQEDLEEAEGIYRAAGLVEEANQAVHNLGYLAMRRGDVLTALRTMQSVRDPLDEGSDVWAAINELDRAEVLRDAGLVTEAETLLEKAAAVLGRKRAPRERAGAEYQLARSLLNHDPDRAVTAARVASRRFRALGSDGWALRAEAIKLRAQLAVGRIDRSGRPARQGRRLPSEAMVEAVVTALRQHRFLAEAEALRLADLRARVRLQRRPMPVSVRIPPRMPLEVTMLAHETRAAVAAVEGREGDCRRHAARGLDALVRTQRAFGSLDLQTSSAMRAGGLLTEGLSSALRSGRPDVIFDWSERARLMSQHVVPLRPPRDEELAADLAELRTIRAAAGDDDWLADPRAQALERRIRDRQWSSTTAGGSTGRIAMPDAIEALGDGEALIAYVFDGERLVALTLFEGSAAIAELSWKDVRELLTGLRADLDVAARVRSGSMSTLVRGSLRARVERLSTVLVQPVQSQIASAHRIAVLAPGVLSGIPWSMLPAFSGRALTVPGSASAWARSRARGPFRLASAGFVIGPRVPRAAEEVGTARGSWPDAPTLSDGSATVSAVTELASRVDVLHAAGHGRHAVDNPMFSGLELVDGTLFGYDVDLIAPVPDTVVLSACEIGRSSVRWGEESVGMARVWLHAGTRAVVAAPVVVADDEACELLGAMHEGLAAGLGPSDALAAASERTGIVAPFQVHGAGF